MQLYFNRNENSGIHSYEYGPEFIIVRFKEIQRLFVYTYRDAGRQHVEAMKVLAKRGSGLEEYIRENTEELNEQVKEQ
ncbi:MAG: hypothetical protein RBS89_01385 [Candidatus Delongbacteria bacterium]|jgi:hypothetical protein|nr:hypothetical protein [Candidatus Delongbacteria bacterium]